MADTTDSDAIIKKAPQAPASDPIVSRSTSGILLVSALLLTGTLAWALYDEVYGQRTWKGIQREFVTRYNRYLKSLNKRGNPTEKQVRESAEYQQLDQEAKAAQAAAEPRKREIDRQVASIEDKLSVITDPFQNKRGSITVINYRIESASDDLEKNELRREVEQEKNEPIEVEMPEGVSGKVQ